MGGGSRAAPLGMSVAVSVQLRDAHTRDLRGVVAIERLAFGDPWTRGMFTTHLRDASGDTFLVAQDDLGEIVGYAIARVVGGGAESELFNIAVHPEWRGRGVGAMLLDASLRRCAAAGATETWLEARASNEAALRLYLSRGFVAVGRRKGYYNAPREDALLLRLELKIELKIELERVSNRSKMVPRAGTGLPVQSGDSVLSSASQPPRQETI